LVAVVGINRRAYDTVTW